MHFFNTNCFYLFQKPPEVRIFSLFNVFDILSHQGFRKKDKNWRNIQNFKISSILVNLGLILR